MPKRFTPEQIAASAEEAVRQAEAEGLTLMESDTASRATRAFAWAARAT